MGIKGSRPLMTPQQVGGPKINEPNLQILLKIDQKVFQDGFIQKNVILIYNLKLKKSA